MSNATLTERNQSIPPLTMGDSSNFDATDILNFVLGNRWLLFATTLAALAIASIYVYFATPIYKTEALVQIEDQKASLDQAVATALGSTFDDKKNVNDEIQIMTARLVLGRVIEKLNLEIVAEPRYFPGIGKSLARKNFQWVNHIGFSPGLRRYSWGDDRIEVTSLEVPDYYLGTEFTVSPDGDGLFSLRLGDTYLAVKAKVGERLRAALPDGGVISLLVNVISADPGTQFLVKRVAMETAYNRLLQSITVTPAARNSSILTINVVGPDRQKATQITNEIANTYLRQNVERRSAEAEKTLDFLKEQLPQVKAKLQASEDALNAYRMKQASVDLTQEATALLTRSTEIETSRMQLEQKRAELMQTLTDVHPSVRTINLQLDGLQQETSRLQNEIHTLPEAQQQLLNLSREVEVNNTLYVAMLNNAQQFEVARAGTIGNIRIIDYALVPINASSPVGFLIRAASIVVGLMAGILIAIVRRLLDRGEHDPQMIEQITGIPAYATVPYSKAQRQINRQGAAQQDTLLAAQHQEDLAIESLRALRTTLHFGTFEADNKVVMLTGPSPGVGKSFVTTNLSAVLAQAGKKVLLIDADLRRGSVHTYFNYDRKPGLSNYILGANLDEVVHHTTIPGLDVICTGDLPPNPAELLLNERMAALIHEAQSRYDQILVDTGPILAVTDAAIVGQLTGTVLLVLKAGGHSRRELEETVKRLTQAGLRLKGLIINQMSTGTGYGYGYGYGYDQKYYYYYKYNKAES